MLRSIGIALVLVAAATVSSPLGARELHVFGGVVTDLTEPGAMVIWGSMLAGLSTLVNRRRSYRVPPTR